MMEKIKDTITYLQDAVPYYLLMLRVQIGKFRQSLYEDTTKWIQYSGIAFCILMVALVVSLVWFYQVPVRAG